MPSPINPIRKMLKEEYNHNHSKDNQSKDFSITDKPFSEFSGPNTTGWKNRTTKNLHLHDIKLKLIGNNWSTTQAFKFDKIPKKTVTRTKFNKKTVFCNPTYTP